MQAWCWKIRKESTVHTYHKYKLKSSQRSQKNHKIIATESGPSVRLVNCKSSYWEMGKRGCEGMDDDMSEVRGGEDKEEEERERKGK